MELVESSKKRKTRDTFDGIVSSKSKKMLTKSALQRQEREMEKGWARFLQMEIKWNAIFEKIIREAEANIIIDADKLLSDIESVRIALAALGEAYNTEFQRAQKRIKASIEKEEDTSMIASNPEQVASERKVLVTEKQDINDNWKLIKNNEKELIDAVDAIINDADGGFSDDLLGEIEQAKIASAEENEEKKSALLVIEDSMIKNSNLMITASPEQASTQQQVLVEQLKTLEAEVKVAKEMLEEKDKENKELKQKVEEIDFSMKLDAEGREEELLQKIEEEKINHNTEKESLLKTAEMEKASALDELRLRLEQEKDELVEKNLETQESYQIELQKLKEEKEVLSNTYLQQIEDAKINSNKLLTQNGDAYQELERKVTSLQNDLETLRAQYTSAEETNNSLTSELEELRQLRQSDSLELRDANEKIQRLQNDLDVIRDTSADKEEVTKLIIEKQAELDGLSEEKRLFEEKIAQQVREMTAIEEKRLAEEKLRIKAEEDLEEVTLLKENLEGDTLNLAQENANLKEMMEEDKKTIVNVEKEKKELVDTLVDLEATHDELKETLAKEKENHLVTTRNYEDLEIKQATTESQLEEARKELSKYVEGSVADKDDLQKILDAKTSLVVAQNVNVELQTKLKDAETQAKSANDEAKKHAKELSETKAKLKKAEEETEEIRKKAKSIVESVENVHLYQISSGTTKQIVDRGKNFSPSKHTSVILYDDIDKEKNAIQELLLDHARFRALLLYDQTAYPYLYKNAAINGLDTKQFGDQYRAISTTNLNLLLKNNHLPAQVPDDGSEISKKPTKEATIKKSVGKKFTVGEPVFALNMINMIDQVVWQERFKELSESTPGAFTVEMRFSQGPVPKLGRKELHFEARNVHLIKDPTGASDDLFYVINLAGAASLVNLHYYNLGSLVMNSIHAKGSLAYRVITPGDDRKSVRADQVAMYEFPANPLREYNTKVMLHPNADITFYARDTKSDTFFLETILINSVKK